MNARKRKETPPSGNVHGILVLDKPAGITSHGVVSAVRKAFGTRRVGHAGTLDPMATGVLVVLLGEATKLSSVLTTERKSYEAKVRFGETTDTLDAQGKVLKRVPLLDDWLSPEGLESALTQERHRRLQIPPQVSAIKVDGQRAYARARRGESTELAPRDVQVHELECRGFDGRELDLSVVVSKGYYVRSLARDLGDILRVGGHLSALRRTQSGAFTIDQAASWPPDARSPLLTLGEVARGVLPWVEVTEEGTERISQGKRVGSTHFSSPEPPAGAPITAVFHNGSLIALVEPSENGEFRVKRGINDPRKELDPVPLNPVPLSPRPT
jgi:tRNA pseudouridine55 synthase